LRLSTVFHHKTNYQTEQINTIPDQDPCTYISCQQDNWSLWLSLTEFVTNNCYSVTTEINHFDANSGCHFCLNFNLTEQQDKIENLDTQEHAMKLD
jgi:hypothetical protein